MAKKRISILEINGQRYDAGSGTLLNSPGEALASVPQIIVPTVTGKPKTARQAAAHTKHHSTQRSNTLIRSAVSKPQPATRRTQAGKARANTLSLAAKPSIELTPKLSVRHIQPQRLTRAKTTPKSQHIQHYGAASRQSAYEAHVPVASKPPVHRPVVHTATKPAAHNPSHVLFEKALAHATAHEEAPYNPKKHARTQRKHARKLKRTAQPWYRRTSTLAGTSLAVVSLTALVALQYRPALSIQLASARAGFSATLPSFRPADFGYGAIHYTPGKVAINFHSDRSNRSYSLEQQTSNWDNQTLLSQQVTNKSRTYQSVSIAGRTVFLYGQNNASWLDNGVLYKLNSNGALSTTDVLNIASSL